MAISPKCFVWVPDSPQVVSIFCFLVENLSLLCLSKSAPIIMEYLCSSFSIDSIMNLKCLPTVEYVVPAPHTFSQRESSPEF